jgi:hypothetical protein
MRANGKEEIWKRLQTVLAERRQRWALTGADAAQHRTHFFRTEETAIYAPLGALEDRETLKALVAQPAARAGTCWSSNLPVRLQYRQRPLAVFPSLPICSPTPSCDIEA